MLTPLPNPEHLAGIRRGLILGIEFMPSRTLDKFRLLLGFTKFHEDITQWQMEVK